MEFFSGLKKAYEVVGAEINRTFDSSQLEEVEARENRSPPLRDAVVRLWIYM